MEVSSVGSPEAGVTGNCELPNTSAATKLGLCALSESGKSLNHGLPPQPTFPFSHSNSYMPKKIVRVTFHWLILGTNYE